MLSAGEWHKNQPNTILFVLIDSNGEEVIGLDDNFVLSLSKVGASFFASSGFKWEVGDGWYGYTSTTGEANTSGPIAVKVTGAGIIQQNLEYIVDDRIVTAIEFTYTVTSTAGNVPIANVDVVIYADGLMTSVVWSGVTNILGVARDAYSNLPRLEPGTYYFWRNKPGFTFNNPDVEVVS